MANKKTHESFVQEKNEAREQAEANREITKHELEQAEHRLNRAQNYAAYIVGRNNKNRNARLVNKAIAIESICKDSELLSDVEFYQIAEEMFEDENIRKKMADITAGRRKGFEQEKQELHELQMEYQKQKRKMKAKV